MADGDGTAGGVGMGLIIGLLLVVLILIAGGIYMFGGGHGASNPVSAVAGGATHAVSGSVSVH